MTVLYLTRHGETEWNIAGRIQGHKDSALTSLGERQAKWLGKKMNEVEIDIIISSSSGRAIQTAEIIRGDRNIKIIPNDKLREINIGVWEGKYHTEIAINYPEEHRNFWNHPHLYKPLGGETFLQLLTRISLEIEEIISKYEGKNILIVTHAVVLKGLMTYFENKELKDLWSGVFMKSTCLSIIEIEEGNRNIILKGDISHYQYSD